MLLFGRSMREAGILSEDSDKVSGNNPLKKGSWGLCCIVSRSRPGLDLLWEVMGRTNLLPPPPNVCSGLCTSCLLEKNVFCGFGHLVDLDL